MENLGDTLRAARQERGLSLDDIERATRIRRKYLDALEREDYAAFPATTYVKGFLRNYAGYLGLDVKKVMALYPGVEESAVVKPIPQLTKYSSRNAIWVVVAAVLLVVGSSGAYLYRENRLVFPEPSEVSIVLPAPTATFLPTYTPRPTATSELLPLPTPTRPPAVRTPILGTTPVASSRPAPTTMVAVPSVGGMSYAQAESSLVNAGFAVRRQDEWNQVVPANVVFAQTPTPGQKLSQGGLVTLLVSKGPTKVLIPNVKGKREEEAKQILMAAGLWIDPVVFYDSSAAAAWTCGGCVTSITPDPESWVEPGTVVKMAVRR